MIKAQGDEVIVFDPWITNQVPVFVTLCNMASKRMRRKDRTRAKGLITSIDPHFIKSTFFRYIYMYSVSGCVVLSFEFFVPK